MTLCTASLCFGVLLLCRTSLGQNANKFLDQHKVEIQNYIMTGYSGGWAHCDVLSLNPVGEDAPQIIMNFSTVNELDLRSAVSFAHCLLAAYQVESKERLSAIINFGWRVLKAKRVAMILTLGNGTTLNLATNTEKLPFLIAARIEGGGNQFLCPVLGSAKPILQNHMCDISYVSYKYKKLRVGLLGMIPHLFPTKVGIDGIDVRLLGLLAKKLKFIPDIVIPRTYEQGANMVNIALKLYFYVQTSF